MNCPDVVEEFFNKHPELRDEYGRGHAKMVAQQERVSQTEKKKTKKRQGKQGSKTAKSQATSASGSTRKRRVSNVEGLEHAPTKRQTRSRDKPAKTGSMSVDLLDREERDEDDDSVEFFDIQMILGERVTKRVALFDSS